MALSSGEKAGLVRCDFSAFSPPLKVAGCHLGISTGLTVTIVASTVLIPCLFSTLFETPSRPSLPGRVFEVAGQRLKPFPGKDRVQRKERSNVLRGGARQTSCSLHVRLFPRTLTETTLAEPVPSQFSLPCLAPWEWSSCSVSAHPFQFLPVLFCFSSDMRLCIYVAWGSLCLWCGSFLPSCLPSILPLFLSICF